MVYKIADFAGGKAFAKDGKYTEQDYQLAREIRTETYRQTAAIRKIKDIEGFIKVNLEALDHILDEYRTMEEPCIWRKIGPVLPQILNEREELRKKHNFSEEHATAARELSDHFYGMEYMTIGALYRAEEGIAHMMKHNFKEAEKAFKFPMEQWVVKDIILRRCLRLNAGLAMSMQGFEDESYFQKGASLLQDTYQRLALALRKSGVEQYSKLITDVLVHNGNLIQDAIMNKTKHDFGLYPINTFIPLILLEEPISAIESTVPEGHFDDDGRGFWERPELMLSDSVFAGIITDDEQRVPKGFEKFAEEQMETTDLIQRRSAPDFSVGDIPNKDKMN